MTTLTIEVPDNVEKTISDLIVKLGGKVLTGDLKRSSIRTTKKKKEILADLERSVSFTKLYKAGKVEAKSIEQLLNEL